MGKLSPSSTKDLHISRAEEILNKESGWSALSGTTNFAAVAAAAAAGPDGPPLRRLAFDLFVNRVCGYVGSYYVSLGGAVDALVFAGGIGERSAHLRAAVVDHTRCLGFDLDPARNNATPPPEDGAVVTDVSARDAKHSVLVCRTDEQFEMARGCAHNGELW